MTAVHDSKPYPAPLAFVAARRRNAAQTFRAAARHSRLVRVLRISVPIAGVVGLVILAMVSWFNPMRLLHDLPIGLRDVVISGTKIKMEQPRLSGFTRDSRPYELNANTAAQDITKPNLVELSELRAKMEMADKSTVELSATNGLFDTKAEILKLNDNIHVTSSNGYEGHLSEAVINTRTGTIASDRPVALKMLQTTINANGLEVEQGGDVVRFKNGVAMQLMPNKENRGKTPIAKQGSK